MTQSGPSIKVARNRQAQRFQFILRTLEDNGSVAVDDLGLRLGVSVVTIRRDLELLEQQRLLRRTHGGAVSIATLYYGRFRNGRSFQAQVEPLASEKRRIGRAAGAFINPGETIAITSDTTTVEVIRSLPLEGRITIVTNAVNIAMELSAHKNVGVFVTGGRLEGEWFSLTGPSAERSLESMLMHTVFLGADGIDAQWGLSCFNSSEAELNAAMVRHARCHIAVADHSKIGVFAKWRICEPLSIHKLITDTGATDEMIAPFQSRGIEVIRV